ncbi:hypothetical protein ACROYT_G023039 [Oculina patagonica]
MKRFTELMNPGAKFIFKDADLDKDPATAEYGGEVEKIKYYYDGVPEKIGRKTVDKLFEGHENWKCGDEWHYIKAFEGFKRMYPRISTGNPLDPWRAVQGDEKPNQEKPARRVRKGAQNKTTNQGGVDERTQRKTKNPGGDNPRAQRKTKNLQPLNVLKAGQGDEEGIQEIHILEYERREALGALRRFKELMKNPEAKDKDADPGTAHEEGVPEKIGRATVDKLFEGHKDWKCGDEWHYVKAFEAFKRMYPRISTGNPLDPWRAVRGDEKGNQEKTRNPWETKELWPLNLLPLSPNEDAISQPNWLDRLIAFFQP